MNPAKYHISVSEPWDFNSPDGENLINGQVIKIINPTCLVFKTNLDINIKSLKGNILILTPRHKHNNFTDLENASGYVVINGSLLVASYSDQMNEQELNDNSVFVLIGSINKT
jgi:hypothetical protein